MVLVAALAAGCGGAARGPAPTIHSGSLATDTVVTAPRQDALFTVGSRWRFDVRRFTDGEPDDGGAPTVTCVVTEVRRFPGGRASQVECDEDESDGDLFGGVWVEDADGLWSGVWIDDDLPTEGETPDLGNADRVLPARLVPGDSGELIADPIGPDRESDAIVTIRADHGTWCVETVAGDVWLDELCFDDRGPLSGRLRQELDAPARRHELLMSRAD